MPGLARRMREARERQLFQAQLEQLLLAVRAKEPAAREQDVVRVAVPNPTWTTRRLEPAVLVLDRAGARLWRGGLDGSASRHAEIGPGWTIRFDGAVLRLHREDRLHVAVVVAAVGLELWLLRGGDPTQGDRASRHRVVAALERALGPAPDVAPRVVIDRVSEARPLEVVCGGLIMGCGLGLAVVTIGERLGALWFVHAAVSYALVIAATLAAGWLWLPRQRARDGRVELYPDRLVHLQDRLVVRPWSAVRGFDDRPSSWVALDCDPPVSIPTVDEATRTAVLAALDAVGLRRSG